MEKRIKRFALNALRRGSYKLPERDAARKKAIVGKEGRKFIYECKMCKEHFFKKDVQIDHILTVIPLDSSEEEVDLNLYVQRLAVKSSGWQLLCKPCHTIKTNYENNLRRKFKTGNITKEELDKELLKFLKEREK